MTDESAPSSFSTRVGPISKVLMVIHPDGHIDLGEGVTPSETARAMFELYESIRVSELATLRADLDELAEQRVRQAAKAAELVEYWKGRAENAEARSALRAVALEKSLSTLPDCGRHDCWHWAWDELDSDAQDEVKDVRRTIGAALTADARSAGELWRALLAEHDATKPALEQSPDQPLLHPLHELRRKYRVVEAARKATGL